MSKFSKQHYVAVAEVINAQVERALAHPQSTPANEQARRDAISSMAAMFGMIFEHDNPRFHLPTFQEAAGLPCGAWPDEPINNHYSPLPKSAVEGYVDPR